MYVNWVGQSVDAALEHIAVEALSEEDVYCV